MAWMWIVSGVLKERDALWLYVTICMRLGIPNGNGFGAKAAEIVLVCHGFAFWNKCRVYDRSKTDQAKRPVARASLKHWCGRRHETQTQTQICFVFCANLSETIFLTNRAWKHCCVFLIKLRRKAQDKVKSEKCLFVTRSNYFFIFIYFFLETC